MQGLQGLDPTDFLAAGQEPLLKLEAYVSGAWVNLCNLQNNRVVDGGFELWDDATHLTHWAESLTGASTINREATVIHGGTYSLRLDIDGAKSLVKATQAITMIPSADYELSFWYKGTKSTGHLLHLSLVDSENNRFLDEDGLWHDMGDYDGGILVLATTTWTKFTLSFAAHASYSAYNIQVRNCAHGEGGASCSIYTDDVIVKDESIMEGGRSGEGNYVESVSISLGGASKTPRPVAGVWSASIFNELSQFHPQHPSSSRKDIFQSGRKVKISVGAIYGGDDYYWPRLIGYMGEPRFSAPDYRLTVSGGDYMKRLEDTELRFGENYWGASETYPSKPSDGLTGAELYIEADAMDINLEEDLVDDWIPPTNCDFDSFGDDTGGSEYVGQLTNIDPAFPAGYIENLSIAILEEGKDYRFRFKHKEVGGDGSVAILLLLESASGSVEELRCFPTDEWQEETIYFTALDDGALKLRIYAYVGLTDLRLDQFSISEYIPYWKRYYELAGVDPDSTGPYFVTLDGDPCWQGEVDEGWYYIEAAWDGPDPPAHPAEIVYFDINKVVPDEVDVVIYYFTHQKPEDVVADLLDLAGLDGAALEFTATPDIAHIDRVWFEPGTTCLNAIKKLCERCDYRFYFKYDGTPVFKPKPAGDVVFTFTDPKQIASSVTYQDQNEIKNRIVIEGMNRAEPVSKEETRPSEFKGEMSDGDSITAYGERTLTIKNHLFQTQDSIKAGDDSGMCEDLLAEYKDPKWYSNIKVPFNPVPFELGDKIQWEERLSPTIPLTRLGWIRDIKINKFTTTYVCELDL